MAGPQLLLELLPERDSVWTGQGRHPRAFASGAHRPAPPPVQSPSGATDAVREPLVAVEVLLLKSDRQPVLWPVLLGAELNVLVSTIGAALRAAGFNSLCSVRSAPLAGPLADRQRFGVQRQTDGWGSPVRPSEFALRVRLRRPVRNRPPTSSEAAGGTSFRFTPGPRSATRSVG
jgi:hypothetical protein